MVFVWRWATPGRIYKADEIIVKLRQVEVLAPQGQSVIESNEAFATQACSVGQTLKFDPAKLNPNGFGVSLGHPVGATGVFWP